MPSPKMVRRIREVDLGVTPNGSPWQELPVNTFEANSPIKRGKPKNIAPDSMYKAHPAETIDASGSCNTAFISALPALIELREEACGRLILPAVNITAANIAAVAPNILQKADGWAGVAVGDLLICRGFNGGGNGAEFPVLITDIAGNDAMIDQRIKVLVNEAAGPSITLHRARQYILGPTRQTISATYETFSTDQGRGNRYAGMVPNKWSIKIPTSGVVEESFTFVGSEQGARITALSDTTAFATDFAKNELRAGLDVFDFRTPNSNSPFGFNYDGTMYTDAVFTTINKEVSNPNLASRGIGRGLTPQSISPDSMFETKLDITVLRGTLDSDALEDDARDADARVSIGFGYRDIAGRLGYWFYPALEPSDEKNGAVKDAGREEYQLSYMAARDDVLQSYFTYSEFDAAP